LCHGNLFTDQAAARDLAELFMPQTSNCGSLVMTNGFWRRDSTPGNTSCGQSTESEGRRRHSSFLRIAEASSCPAYHFQEILTILRINRFCRV
jgi:hypothetical protein